MAKLTCSHHSKDARAILAAALSNYRTVNETLAVRCRTRPPQTGETEQQRDRRAAIYQERADIAHALAVQFQPIQK